MFGVNRRLVYSRSGRIPDRDSLDGISGTGIFRSQHAHTPQDSSKIPVDQMERLHLSKHKLIQRQRNALLCSPPLSSHTWNKRPKQENGAMNRCFNNHVETNHAATLKIYMQNPAFSAVPICQQQTFSPERARMPPQFQWSFDAVHSRNENKNEKPTFPTCPTIECSSHEGLSTSIWNHNMTMTESSVSDESDLSDNEKPDDVLLSYCKSLDTTLSPEVVENVEESSVTTGAQCFTYADVLPPPQNTMELQELASPKGMAWKNGVDPSLESTIGPLVNLVPADYVGQATEDRYTTEHYNVKKSGLTKGLSYGDKVTMTPEAREELKWCIENLDA
ncbi:hypothetical protein NDU88_004602 [Pleurodeles waltl]|uniref:Uncharacterized protein n=1 Tax=Pleurodeles waltl TaxID=8319 RepID=A0AAV7VIR1_PLEWA|nr:hypothetical protein NDU88_004602 [Pleurodeles waltl]